jgi:methylthioribose-1-phosphate isomerase
VPFYVAAPRSTIDFACADGGDIPIEERAATSCGLSMVCDGAGRPGALRQLPADEAVANPAFDVTPASLVSA